MTSKEQNKIIQAYKNILSSEDGRIVMADLKRNFSVSAFSIPRTGNIDPFKTHVDIGKMQAWGYIEHQFNRELLQENDDE